MRLCKGLKRGFKNGLLVLNRLLVLKEFKYEIWDLGCHWCWAS